MAASSLSTACSTMLGKPNGEVNSNEVASKAQTLSAKERRLFNQLAEVLLPDARGDLPNWQSLPVMQTLESVVVDLDPSARADLKLAVSLFDYSPLLMSIKFRTVSLMRKDDVAKMVKKWENGLFLQRGVITSLKSLVYLSYWRDENTWQAIEYDGPVTKKWGINALGNQPLPRS